MRRIFFKIKIDGPNQEMFLKIFAMVAKKKKVPLDEATLIYMLKSKYPTIANNFANYQPTFLIDQMIAVCEFEGIPYQMTPELMDRAWATCSSNRNRLRSHGARLIADLNQRRDRQNRSRR